MKFINKNIGLELEISSDLLELLYREGLKYYPNEFGGILVGRYSEDSKTCIVETTILPTAFKSSVNGFERGNKGLKEQLVDYYNETPSLVYVGEWHTHPNASPTPSTKDKKAMQEIESCEVVKISSPVLIILGINQNNYELGCYVQHLKNLYSYEKL